MDSEKEFQNGPTKMKVRALIGINNFLCKIGITNYGLLAAVIFKNEPAERLQQRLTDSGFDIVNLPENPYITG